MLTYADVYCSERASDVMTCRDLFVINMAGNTVDSIESLLSSTTYQVP
jgi:hypothetical protein